MKVRYCSAALAYDVGTRTYLICTNRKQSSWTFPKGGLEPGISPEENAAKECLEETGYVTSTRGFSLGTYEIFKDGILNRIEVFALALASVYPSGKAEDGRHTYLGSAQSCASRLDRYLTPFVMKLEDHLSACIQHDSAKKLVRK